jgi:hypothetical protein
MGWVKWLVYILSFFIPVFGFITFWVLFEKEREISRNSMIASFFGVVIYIILAAVGVTIFNFLFQGMMPFK